MIISRTDKGDNLLVMKDGKKIIKHNRSKRGSLTSTFVCFVGTVHSSGKVGVRGTSLGKKSRVFTEVEREDKLVAFGISSCNTRYDTFSRAEGRRIAEGRALEAWTILCRYPGRPRDKFWRSHDYLSGHAPYCMLPGVVHYFRQIDSILWNARKAAQSIESVRKFQKMFPGLRLAGEWKDPTKCFIRRIRFRASDVPEPTDVELHLAKQDDQYVLNEAMRG